MRQAAAGVSWVRSPSSLRHVRTLERWSFLGPGSRMAAATVAPPQDSVKASLFFFVILSYHYYLTIVSLHFMHNKILLQENLYSLTFVTPLVSCFFLTKVPYFHFAQGLTNYVASLEDRT